MQGKSSEQLMELLLDEMHQESTKFIKKYFLFYNGQRHSKRNFKAILHTTISFGRCTFLIVVDYFYLAEDIGKRVVGWPRNRHPGTCIPTV